MFSIHVIAYDTGSSFVLSAQSILRWNCLWNLSLGQNSWKFLQHAKLKLHLVLMQNANAALVYAEQEDNNTKCLVYLYKIAFLFN